MWYYTGANVSAKDQSGWAAIQYAAEWGQLDIAKLLIAEGTLCYQASIRHFCFSIDQEQIYKEMRAYGIQIQTVSFGAR